MKGLIVTPQEALALLRDKQTRISRPTKKQPLFFPTAMSVKVAWDYPSDTWILADQNGNTYSLGRCPHNVGDVVYVKETFGSALNRKGIVYRADCSNGTCGATVWHPSVHMTQDLARTFLKIISVKAMREDGVWIFSYKVERTET